MGGLQQVAAKGDLRHHLWHSHRFSKPLDAAQLQEANLHPAVRLADPCLRRPGGRLPSRQEYLLHSLFPRRSHVSQPVRRRLPRLQRDCEADERHVWRQVPRRPLLPDGGDARAHPVPRRPLLRRGCLDTQAMPGGDPHEPGARADDERRPVRRVLAGHLVLRWQPGGDTMQFGHLQQSVHSGTVHTVRGWHLPGGDERNRMQGVRARLVLPTGRSGGAAVHRGHLLERHKSGVGGRVHSG